jgi:adenosylmethionine-8-amino-7-oxononanoate aminotransferase
VKFTNRVVAAGFGHGAFFYPGGAGAARDLVCLGPPFTISDDEIEFIATALPKAIDNAAASVPA